MPMSCGTPAAFPIPPRHISAIEMPSLKACKNALRPRKVSAYRRLRVSTSERPLFRSGYGIRQREIKYSQLIVGANTRVEVEHQKRQNSKYHRKQGQRRAMGAIFCEREAKQNNREHEGRIAKDHYLFGTTSFTGSTCFRSRCLLCGNDGQTFQR